MSLLRHYRWQQHGNQDDAGEGPQVVFDDDQVADELDRGDETSSGGYALRSWKCRERRFQVLLVRFSRQPGQTYLVEMKWLKDAVGVISSIETVLAGRPNIPFSLATGVGLSVAMGKRLHACRAAVHHFAAVLLRVDGCEHLLQRRFGPRLEQRGTVLARNADD